MPYKFEVGDPVRVLKRSHSVFSGYIGTITKRGRGGYRVRFYAGPSVFWFAQRELEPAPAKKKVAKKRKK